MDYLNQEDALELANRRRQDPFVDASVCQLNRILSSQAFGRVQRRAKNFLSFVVIELLLGRQEEIKEATIAIHVFHAPADYNTAESSRIRVAAQNLRKKLEEYFSSEGESDSIEISIPKGTYVPEVSDRRMTVAVRRFEDWNVEGNRGLLCRIISEEIAKQLHRAGIIEVTPVAVRHSSNPCCRYQLRGSVECLGDSLILNTSLSDLVRHQIIHSQRFEERRDAIFKLSDQVSSAIAAALQSQLRCHPDIQNRKVRSLRKRRATILQAHGDGNIVPRRIPVSDTPLTQSRDFVTGS